MAVDVSSRVGVAVRERTETGGDSVVAAGLDANIVRRVAVDQVDRLTVEQPIHIFRLAGIATQQPVLPEQPQVARLRCRLVRQAMWRVNATLVTPTV